MFGVAIQAEAQNLVAINEGVIVAKVADLSRAVLDLVFGNVDLDEAAYARTRRVGNESLH